MTRVITWIEVELGINTTIDAIRMQNAATLVFTPFDEISKSSGHSFRFIHHCIELPMYIHKHIHLW